MFACLWICLTICISLSRGQNCDTYSEVLKCYTDQGLDFSLQSDLTAETLLKQASVLDPSVQCTDINKYKNAMSCAMTFLKTCLRPSGFSGIVPDIQLMNQGMDYFCRNLNNFDVACYEERIPSVAQCGETVGYAVGQSYTEVSTMTAIEIVCLSFDVNYDCILVHMSSCPKSTSQILLNLVDKYFLPSACLDKNPSRANRQSYTYLASDASGRGHHSDHHYLILLVGVFSLLSLI